MKIGILTLPLHNNYGGILQNYALQTVLKRLGHEVWTLDRQLKTSFLRDLRSTSKRIILRLFNKNVKIRSRRSRMNSREMSIISKNTRNFIRQHITITEKIFYTFQLKRVVKKKGLEAVVVGSDQVWRPKYTPSIFDYFLTFTQGTAIKRLAYAASFGVDTWEFTKRATRRCASLADTFDGISVREKSGLKLCEDYLGVQAEHTLDPTMLLSKNDYQLLVKNKNLTENAGKLFVYLLDKSVEKERIVSIISEEKKIKEFEVSPEIIAEKYVGNTKNLDLSKCVYPPVEEWLKAFVDADFVVTDSFHGTVFSIIFNKPFIAFGNEERGLSRFTSLLKQFDLEDRLHTESDENFNINDFNEINWTVVNAVLEEKRRESHSFLEKHLKN